LFLTLNRNKKSVVINLKTDAGRNLFYDPVKLSDIVIDNFRPGVLERLKIDYESRLQVPKWWESQTNRKQSLLLRRGCFGIRR
jgi:CoA-transferase family III